MVNRTAKQDVSTSAAQESVAASPQAQHFQRLEKLQSLAEQLVATLGHVFHTMTGKIHPDNESFFAAGGVNPDGGMYVKLAACPLLEDKHGRTTDEFDLDALDRRLEDDLKMFFDRLTIAAGNNDDIMIDRISHQPATVLAVTSPLVMVELLETIMAQAGLHSLETGASHRAHNPKAGNPSASEAYYNDFMVNAATTLMKNGLQMQQVQDLYMGALPVRPYLSAVEAFAEASVVSCDAQTLNVSLARLRVMAQNILHPQAAIATEDAIYRLH